MAEIKSDWEKHYGSEIVAALGLALIILFILNKPEPISSMDSITSIWAALILGIILIFVGLISSKHKCELMIIITIAVSAILCYKIYFSEKLIEMNGHYLLVAIAGIAALIIPIILSISSNSNLGSKLDSGEVRKSIVISLTIIYIIFLVMSFEQTLNEQQPATGGKYLLNVTYDEKANNTSQKFIYLDINSTSEGVLQVIPVTATANVSNGTIQITPLLPQKPGTGNESGGMIPLTGDNGTSLPTDAINSFTKNFLWVYALIISFYFGSRIWEDRADKSVFNEYISEIIKSEKRFLDPLDIAKARLSLGELGPREYNKLKKCLDEKPTVRIEEAYFKEVDKKEEAEKMEQEAEKMEQEAKKKKEEAEKKMEEAEKMEQEAKKKETEEAERMEQEAEKMEQEAEKMEQEAKKMKEETVKGFIVLKIWNGTNMNIVVDKVKINSDIELTVISSKIINRKDNGIIVAETDKSSKDITKVIILAKPKDASKSDETFTDETSRIF